MKIQKKYLIAALGLLSLLFLIPTYIQYEKSSHNVFEQDTGIKEATEECRENGPSWYVKRDRIDGKWVFTCERY